MASSSVKKKTTNGTNANKTSTKSNTNVNPGYGSQPKNTNVNPGYGTQSTWRQNELKKTSSSTYDKNRGTVTYGGYGRNASTGNFKYPQNTNSTSTSGSSGSSGSSGGGSSQRYEEPEYEETTYEETPEQEYVPGSWDYSGLIDVYINDLNERAKAAYDRSMNAVNEYYNAAKNNLNANYNSSLDALNANDANNKSAINADAEEAMRQAYVNNMLSRKAMQQALMAQGLVGGASETTQAAMENNYGNARNAIDTTRNKNLADLLAKYQNNLTGLKQQLNNGLTDLDSQRLSYSMQVNDSINNLLQSYADKITDWITTWGSSADPLKAIQAIYIADEGKAALDAYNGSDGAASLTSVPNNYISNLQTIAGNSKSFTPEAATANNAYTPTSFQQLGQMTNSNYAKALAAQEALGATTPQAQNTALSQYSNISSLQNILKQLGYM